MYDRKGRALGGGLIAVLLLTAGLGLQKADYLKPPNIGTRETCKTRGKEKEEIGRPKSLLKDPDREALLLPKVRLHKSKRKEKSKAGTGRGGGKDGGARRQLTRVHLIFGVLCRRDGRKSGCLSAAWDIHRIVIDSWLEIRLTRIRNGGKNRESLGTPKCHVRRER